MNEKKDDGQFEIKIKTTKTLLKNSTKELSVIVEMILKMAYETEEKKLNSVLVQKAIEKLLIYPVYGHYFFIIDLSTDRFCGMNLVTFEHNINSDSTILWIQSVYVQEDYRMKGLFRRLLYTNEDFVLDNPGFKKTVKLYMDKDNSKAEKVYFKVGFKVCRENLYELDFHFDDIKELKEENFQNHSKDFDIKILGTKPEIVKDSNNNNFHGGIFQENFYDYINDVTSNNNAEVYDLFENTEKNIQETEFESLINLNTVVFKNEKEKLLKVINNRNLGAVLLITDGKNSMVYGFAYIFYEISDWRNSYFWWLYDIYVKPNYKELVINHIEEIVFRVVKLNYELSGCGVRVIANENSEYLMEKTILEKSNYIIYEKEL